MTNKLNFIASSLGLILMLLLSTGCFAPINSTFESAKLLEKGSVEVQGSASAYFGLSIDEPFFSNNGNSNWNNNFGFAFGYGISDRLTTKFRYERIRIDYTNQFFDKKVDVNGSIHYFEWSNKISLLKDKIALSMPIGAYWSNDKIGLTSNRSPAFVLSPKVIFTHSISKMFEFSVIPKATVGLESLKNLEDMRVLPGINIGLGISSDLSQWAIRPEMGFDGFLTVGVGFNYYLKSKKKR